MIKLLFTLLISGHLFAGTPIEKMVPVDDVFVPNGFDDNDSTEVIISGFLPNLCHKSPKSVVKKKENKIEIEVTSLHYHESNPFCPEVIVPFTLSVDLGILKAKLHNLKINSNSQWEKKTQISISHSSTQNIDEFMYANASHVELVKGTRKVLIKGYNPSDCLELDRIEYQHNKKNVFSVLPIMKQVREFCPKKLIPFTYEWEVPESLEVSRLLLHVRTMQGRSVNQLIVLE
ncbi:MAG: hypothetical protein CME62_12535 [Halobacteriovoraceae bacterium]|nr:hypothetical protein [Halobacteriovoraceae bacterium]|tara:strand:- start:3474 stop:4169 length:696 start_codon:yes stop_codon:yes gene_type:complete